MFCPNCGAENDDNAFRCVSCGADFERGPAPAPSAAKPPNYLVWSILTTLFCCLPFGIVSIVYAAQVDSKFASGDYAGAAESSRKAKNWALVSCLSGVGIAIIYILLAVVMGMSGAMQ